jgi:hypothetical protein
MRLAYERFPRCGSVPLMHLDMEHRSRRTRGALATSITHNGPNNG